MPAGKRTLPSESVAHCSPCKLSAIRDCDETQLMADETIRRDRSRARSPPLPAPVRTSARARSRRCAGKERCPHPPRHVRRPRQASPWRPTTLRAPAKSGAAHAPSRRLWPARRPRRTRGRSAAARRCPLAAPGWCTRRRSRSGNSWRGKKNTPEQGDHARAAGQHTFCKLDPVPEAQAAASRGKAERAEQHGRHRQHRAGQQEHADTRARQDGYDCQRDGAEPERRQAARNAPHTMQPRTYTHTHVEEGQQRDEKRRHRVDARYATDTWLAAAGNAVQRHHEHQKRQQCQPGEGRAHAARHFGSSRPRHDTPHRLPPLRGRAFSRRLRAILVVV
jgi:hypothetical protein